jgi:hypothetical protein
MPASLTHTQAEILRVNTFNVRFSWLSLASATLALLALAGCGGGNNLPANPLLPPGVLYQDDFEQPSEGWDSADDGIVSYLIQEGRLVVTVDRPTAHAWSTLQYRMYDFALDFDALKLAGPDDNGFGVLFRYQDTENYYRFDISSDGYYSVSKTAGGIAEEISPWKASDAILLGEQTNHLRLVAQGNAFSFEVNGIPLNLCVGPGALWDPQSPDTCLGGEVMDTWMDDAFPEGQIALGVTSFGEPGPSIGFDNVVISESDAAP